MNEFKQEVACKDDGRRTLEDACVGADVFIGVSSANALKKEWAAKMNKSPVVLAMANPVPEITLDDLQQVLSS